MNTSSLTQRACESWLLIHSYGMGIRFPKPYLRLGITGTKWAVEEILCPVQHLSLQLRCEKRKDRIRSVS